MSETPDTVIWPWDLLDPGFMASSEVDQKFLGRLAKAVEHENPLLAAMLFKILGLSINLSQQLVNARRERRQDPSRDIRSLKDYYHMIWLSREGLVMLEQYVLPMVGNYGELKVLAYKLRASFYHIFVLYHNNPPVSWMGISTPDVAGQLSGAGPSSRVDKGKGIARDSGSPSSRRSSLQPTHPFEGGPVGPPPGFGFPQTTRGETAEDANFLLPAADYLPTAHKCFLEAVKYADTLLWGSHSLRLSVKVEYAAFMYECLHDAEGSRQLAKRTITEVYEASEGMDDDMFNDACELVAILGKMMKRGLGSSNTLRSRAAGGPESGSGARGTPQPELGNVI